MSEGMLTANRDGVVTAVNDALYTMLEYKAGNMIGSSLNDVISTRQAGFSEFIDVVEIDDSPFQQLICDVQMQDGGYLPVIISGSSIQQDNGEVEEFVFVFSNLTEIREIERMRDDFFNNIVHELRTPLATILMYARLLRSGDIDKDSEKKARFLDTIEQESNRLQIMVRQMLHLAKLQAAQTQRGEESTPLNPVFDQILPPLAERAAVKGLVFRQDIEQNLLEVQCDEDTLYLIFKNLIENAIKFTPEGVVSVGAHLDGEWVRVEIVDEGIGIPPEGLPNLFSRYYRAQTAVEKGIAGTGLGLHLVKEGLDHCGGTIEVRSKPGLGTTIITQIPRTLKS
jgi:two-component system phosphate regulon sensor histidine kinase PhoR